MKEDQFEQLSQSRLNLSTMFRIGLFNLGLGLMSVLTLAVLNRVMISELAIPASVTAGTLAISQVVAPARIWFGRLSDLVPIGGLYRSNYVRLGTIFAGLSVFAAVQVVWLLGKTVVETQGWLWNGQTLILTLLLGLILGGYGLAISLSSTPFTAMLVDISSEKQRSQLVAIVWSMLMVGIVVGGISGSIVLKIIEIDSSVEILQNTINLIFILAPVVVFCLALIATWEIEKRYSRLLRTGVIAGKEDENLGLGAALKILTTNRQTGIFFSFLVILTLGLFMQEAVLEPYGGDVFGMSIAKTTLLNSFWGIGILIGYSFTGFLIIPRLGKVNTAKLGCVLVAICFVLIILAGLTQTAAILKGTLIVYGIATGIATVSSISLMLDFTVAQSAGTFIGAWGLAQSFARAMAIFSGGVVLDIGQQLFDTPLLAYSLVFTIQGVLMLVAIIILKQINLREFTNRSQGVTLAMESDLDG